MEIAVFILFIVCSVLIIIAIRRDCKARDLERNMELLEWLDESGFTPKVEYLAYALR